jgi:hypothetical protein
MTTVTRHASAPRRLGRVLAALGLWWALASHPGQGQAQEPRRPRLTVPRVAKAPTVDGRMDPGEWDGAAVVTGLMAATGPRAGLVEAPPARVYLAHDGKNFYMAVHCELRPGEVPTRKYRKRDDPVYLDSSQLELWLAPPADKGPLTAYQMIGNAYGAIFDTRQVPDLGSVVAGWNGRYTLKSTFEKGKSWVAELSVPFADFGVDRVGPDQEWGGLVAVAWPQRSWPYPGGWYKNVRQHAVLTFADGGDCVRLEDLDLSALPGGPAAARATLVNAGGQDADFTVSVKAGADRHDQKVRVRSHGREPVALKIDLPDAKGAKDAKQAFTLEVTGPGGRTLLAGDWSCRPAEPGKDPAAKAPEPERPFAARVQFAPQALGLKLWADVLDYPRRKELARVRFRVQAENQGKAVATRDVTDFAYDAAETYLWLPKDLPLGRYEVHTEFLAAGGAVLDRRLHPFEHKDLKKQFYWWGNGHGARQTVIPPFTPVKAGEKSIAVWGREYRMQGALPAQVLSRQAEMLARPMTFAAEVGGKTVEATVTEPFRLEKADGVRAEFRGRYEVAGVTLELTGRAEFDGMIAYSLRATPAAGARVDRLYLVMSVKAEHAATYYSTAGGWSAAYGFVPAGPSDKPFWTSDGLADFVPYVGLGDDDRAIQWFADNDHDWVLGHDAPCAELRRRPGAVELRVNLVRRSGALAGPFAARFGVIATPIKPLPAGWRHACLHFAPVAGSKINFFFGPGHGGCPVDPHDTRKLAGVLGVDLKGKDPDEVLDRLPAGSGRVPDLKALQKLGGNWAAAAHAELAGKPGPVRQCYFFNASMYFEGYRSEAFSTLFPGEWTLEPSSGWFHLTPVDSYRDFFAFYMDLWMRHWVMPGMYFDECYLAPDLNVFSGNGKVMPDGSVRGSVPLMHQRAFLNRMRQLFADNGRTPFLWVHSSNYMAPHAISAADVAMFGEDRSPTPASDVIDTIPPVLLRSIGRAQKFGFIPLWMNQAGRGDGAGPHAGFYGRQLYGWAWLHDVVPEYHTSNRGHALVAVRKAWGIDEDDVAFVPYWGGGTALKTDDSEFLVSAWTRPGGKALLEIMNLHKNGKTSVSLTLDAKALGLPAGFKVYDVEQGPMLGPYTADMREADRLLAQGTAADRERAGKILKAHAAPDAKVRYDPAQWQLVGQGPTVRVTVPARDFVTLVVE